MVSRSIVFQAFLLGSEVVCLVVNHFLSLSAVALAGAAVNNSRVVLAKKLGRYSIDTWSLLASFWGFQRTQSGHIWGGPNMSCWKGDALNIDLFGSTAFWGRIGEQNRHTCHWNEHHHTRQQCCLDCYLLNKRLLLFYRCYGRFLSRDGGWPHWKKNIFSWCQVKLWEKSKVSYGQIAKFTLLLKMRWFDASKQL